MGQEGSPPLNISNELPKLRKALSSIDIFLLTITGMFGSGWLLGMLAGPAYAGPAIILVWILVGVFFIILTLIFAELGSTFHYSGSLVRFNDFTHGPLSNFFLGWAYVIGAVSTAPLEAEAVTTFLSTFYPSLYNTSVGLLSAQGVIVSLILVVFFVIIQYIGVNVFAKANAVMTWFKITAMVLIIIFAFAFIFHSKNFFSLPRGFLPYGSATIFAAMVPSGIVFAYEGFRQGLDYAGETKNPKRSVPLGMISAIIVAMIAYVLLQIAFIGAINWKSAGVTPGNWVGLLTSSWSANPFYYAFYSTGSHLLMGFGIFIIVVAIVSVAATLAVFVGTSGRVLYGMAKLNYFPSFFGRIHPRFQTPWISLIAIFIISVIFLLPFPSWYKLVGINASFTVFAYLSVGITNIVLRKTYPELKRAFSTPGLSVVAPIGFIIASMLLYWSGWGIVGPIIFIINGGLPLLILGPIGKNVLRIKYSKAITFGIIYWIVIIIDGLIFAYSLLPFYVYYTVLSLTIIIAPIILYRVSEKGTKNIFRAYSWLIPYEIILGVISYYGSLGMNIIIFPYDYIVFAIVSGIIYYVAIRVGFESDSLKEFKANKGEIKE